MATGITAIPNDNTIPQNTEGTQFMSATITPRSALNLLEISHLGFYSTGSVGREALALFQDTTANALATAAISTARVIDAEPAMLQYTMSAGTTSATTFKIREGSSSGGTVTFNGEDGAAYYGGTLTSTLTIKEICL